MPIAAALTTTIPSLTLEGSGKLRAVDAEISGETSVSLSSNYCQDIGAMIQMLGYPFLTMKSSPTLC